MATLAQLIPRIFKHAWQRYGQPTLTAVRPMSYWNMPVGFAYDQDVDAIRDSAGDVLTNVFDYWTSDMIYILPTKSAPGGGDVAELQALLVPGVAQTGEVSVWVLRDDIYKLRVAHAILLGDQWYYLVSQQQAPAGFPDSTGLWARVRLRGR